MSTTIAKPEIIIIPGSFCSLKYYDPVVADLKSHGYSVHGIELETVGRRDTPAPSMYDDAAAIAALVSRLADEGKDVVLVPHSYGGVPTCEAAKGLAKSVREKEGKAGGIARILFVSSVVPKEGESLKDAFGDTALDFIGIEGEYMYMADPVKSAAINVSDLPPDEGLVWAKKFTQHSAASFVQPLTYGAYKDIPVSWMLLEQDKCIPPELQNKMIANMESVMGGRTVERFPVDVGHCINFTQPATFAKVVRRALGEKV
ncbi:Alpha/beta hydrolase fold-1 [Mycena metata]|uniref:Alpha/beta hydrolase fold-1 n=1 Tax=Mycena metata TaxID=1033252 RepID=A0AAD7HJJ7_9AGAR|nr:Alpha/beta hydrolase fold-1 [Mycena metata]KAJ7744700.1 Alpha/beta hydrolase fold-1 [Mycena metata]